MCIVIKCLFWLAMACGAAIPLLGAWEIWCIVVRGEKRDSL